MKKMAPKIKKWLDKAEKNLKKIQNEDTKEDLGLKRLQKIFDWANQKGRYLEAYVYGGELQEDYLSSYGATEGLMPPKLTQLSSVRAFAINRMIEVNDMILATSGGQFGNHVEVAVILRLVTLLDLINRARLEMRK